MFVLNSWHYFKLQFLHYYNLFRRVLPFLTQRMAPWNVKLSLEPQSNSYNFFPFSSSKCRPAVPEAWAPANAGAHAESLFIYIYIYIYISIYLCLARAFFSLLWWQGPFTPDFTCFRKKWRHGAFSTIGEFARIIAVPARPLGAQPRIG